MVRRTVSIRKSTRKFAPKSALRRVGRGRTSRRISRPCKSVRPKLTIRSRRRLGGSSNAAAHTSTPIMTDYLTKEAMSGTFRNWKKRWFELDVNGVLCYYTDKTKITRKGVIFLDSEGTVSNSDKKDYCFHLSVGGTNLYAHAENEQDKTKWVNALERRIKSPLVAINNDWNFVEWDTNDCTWNVLPIRRCRDYDPFDETDTDNKRSLEITNIPALPDFPKDLRKNVVKIEIDIETTMRSAIRYTHIDQYRKLFSELISFIKTCTNVTELQMCGECKMQYFDFDTQLESLVKTCKQLSKLDLQGMKVTNTGVRKIVDHLNEQLVDLNLAKTLVEDIAALQHCTNLLSVDLSDTGVKDIAALQHCTELRIVKLANTKVTNIDALDTCRKLVTIDISSTQVMNIRTLWHRTGVLKEVKLKGNKQLVSQWYNVNIYNTAYVENPDMPHTPKK